MQCCTSTPNATKNDWLYDSHMKTSAPDQAGATHWVSNDPRNKVATRKWQIIRAKWHYGPNTTRKQFLHRHNQPPELTCLSSYYYHHYCCCCCWDNHHHCHSCSMWWMTNWHSNNATTLIFRMIPKFNLDCITKYLQVLHGFSPILQKLMTSILKQVMTISFQIFCLCFIVLFHPLMYVTSSWCSAIKYPMNPST
jgi:hypothetical protein